MTDDRQIAEQLEHFAASLKERGLKMTRQREIVVECFLRVEGHVSAEELYELAKKQDQRIGLATVFRTLKTLKDCGLAREIDLGDGRSRFEHDYRRPHHHHLICDQCGRAIEFFSPEFERLQEKIVREYKFEPLRHTLQIFGICDDCRTEREGDRPVFDSDLVFARDALKIAMATEERGINFYRTAAETVKDPTTRKTFLEMLEEEQGHLDSLTKEWNRLIGPNKEVLEAPVFLHFDYDALKRIFPSREEVRRKLKEDMTAREALELAMRMERDAHSFFSQYAERFNDTQGRDIFLKFAEEEEEHYELIRKEYDRLMSEASDSSSPASPAPLR